MTSRPTYFLIALALATSVSPRRARADELALAGLAAPVEVVRDKWGIAHIYARNEHDLFFAQGYNVAQDRLFQLELWRRQATGTLAEIQGVAGLPHDVGARLLKFRGDMTRELKHYHPHGPEILQAFVDGINAYIARCERSSDLLPLEFRILGIKPGRWSPEIVVSRHNGLFRNVTAEVAHAQLASAVGAAAAVNLLNLHPGTPALETDPAVDLAAIDPTVIALYSASRAPIRFRPADVLDTYRAVESASARAGSEPDGEGRAEGSNNWIIAGNRSATGHPIMANDPHRTIQLPSLRYWVHLVAPGWNVIGAGEPALPGVSVGHNERGAWGFTIFPIDQEDLYVYEIDPSDHSRYRYRDGWEAFRTEREKIVVKGRGEIAIALRFTRHGPVIHEDRAGRRAYAVRAAWLEEGAAPYLSGLRMNQAANWTEFREACRYFYTPSENLIWADVDGHTGWQAVGLAPIRPNWTGLVPVSGDGRYEWNGYLPAAELPSVSNPSRGWFASANQDNLPANYPHSVGFEWTDPFRFTRIEEVLAASPKMSIDDARKLQLDELSMAARALVPLLRGLRLQTPMAQSALEQMAGWNFVLDRDSVPAAIYTAWERELRLGVATRLVPVAARRVFGPGALSVQKMIALLSEPDDRFGADPRAARDRLVLDAFGRAIDGLENRLGPDMSHWKYGQSALKHIELRHPLSDAVRADVRSKLDLESLPRGGYAHTVNSTSDADNQATGASFRLIADVADWDRSIGTNTPGQSGNPASPHYRDLYKPWAAGEYFPVCFSRARVETVAESKLTLLPAAAPR
jgi:penicillin amidase